MWCCCGVCVCVCVCVCMCVCVLVVCMLQVYCLSSVQRPNMDCYVFCKAKEKLDDVTISPE